MMIVLSCPSLQSTTAVSELAQGQRQMTLQSSSPLDASFEPAQEQKTLTEDNGPDFTVMLRP